MEKNKTYLIECCSENSESIQKFAIRFSEIKKDSVFCSEAYSIKQDELTYEGGGFVCLESEIKTKTELSEEQFLLLLSNRQDS